MWLESQFVRRLEDPDRIVRPSRRTGSATTRCAAAEAILFTVSKSIMLSSAMYLVTGKAQECAQRRRRPVRIGVLGSRAILLSISWASDHEVQDVRPPSRYGLRP